MLPIYKKNANYYCSILYHFLKYYFSKLEVYSKTIYFQLNNYYKENKNNVFFQMLVVLMYKSLSSKLIIIYLPLGYIYKNINTFFSLLKH